MVTILIIIVRTDLCIYCIVNIWNEKKMHQDHLIQILIWIQILIIKKIHHINILNEDSLLLKCSFIYLFFKRYMLQGDTFPLLFLLLKYPYLYATFY